MKQELSASIVFSSMTVFDLLKDQLGMIFWFVSNIVNAKVSLDRVDDFLKNVRVLTMSLSQYVFNRKLTLSFCRLSSSTSMPIKRTPTYLSSSRPCIPTRSVSVMLTSLGLLSPMALLRPPGALSCSRSTANCSSLRTRSISLLDPLELEKLRS